jgi:hypothetical protein
VLRWAKGQGAVTGYAHSASGLHIDPKAASERLLAELRTAVRRWRNPREAAWMNRPPVNICIEADAAECVRMELERLGRVTD